MVTEATDGPASGQAPLVRGLSRTMRAAGGAGAFTLALVWAQARVPGIVDRWLALHRPKPSPDLMWMPPPSESELVLARTQPRTFLITTGVVLAAVSLWFALDAFLTWRRPTRLAAAPLGALVAVLAVVFAAKASPFAGTLALVSVPTIALIFARYERGGQPAPRPASKGGLLAAVLVIEALSLAWGVWLTFWSAVGILSALLLIAAAAAAAFRAATDLAGPDGTGALERRVTIGSPLLILAFLGIQRDPSPWWIAVALVLCVGVAAALTRRALPVAKIARALEVIVAPTALMTIFTMPMRFRELASIDNFDHESQHLGWLNSISFGKLMMADAGYIYGPLREYLLYLYSAVGGLTLEHVREAHTWTNVLGIALMLFAGWRVARGRAWLHFWWAYLLLTQTALLFLMKYRDQLSFGWADLARSGFACAALVAGIEHATAADLAHLPGGFLDSIRANRALIAWGAVCGLGTLYSQDFGPCAAGAVGFTIVLDSFLRRDLGSLGERIRRALILGLAWSVGVLGVLLGFLAIYACFGKAGLMIQRLTTWTGFLLSASWSGTPFAFGASSWLDARGYLRNDRGFPAICYALPALFILLGGAVVVLAAVRRAWTPRVALLCALFLFALTTFRHALMRADIFHARANGTGALLLFFALVADVAQLRMYVGRRLHSVPVGAALGVALALVWPAIDDSWAPLQEKVKGLASGDDSPSHGAAYANKDMPRAGDLSVPANVRALVHYVSETTKPSDPVWVTTGFMTGGALQFVIDRRNPTAFDVAHELTTRGDQAELMHALTFDPPILIVGDYFNLIGDEAHAYIAQHWKRESVPGYGAPVLRYQQPSDPANSTH